MNFIQNLQWKFPTNSSYTCLGINELMTIGMVKDNVHINSRSQSEFMNMNRWKFSFLALKKSDFQNWHIILAGRTISNDNG